jgi:hypothetical protein
MKATEPGSTGTLKSAMTTTFPFPDATGWTDAVAEQTKKLLTTSKSSAATSKPKITETRKIFPLNFNNLFHSWLFSKLPISFGITVKEISFSLLLSCAKLKLLQRLL